VAIVVYRVLLRRWQSFINRRWHLPVLLFRNVSRCKSGRNKSHPGHLYKHWSAQRSLNGTGHLPSKTFASHNTSIIELGLDLSSRHLPSYGFNRASLGLCLFCLCTYIHVLYTLVYNTMSIVSNTNVYPMKDVWLWLCDSDWLDLFIRRPLE
jgi:hypothetical protein